MINKKIKKAQKILQIITDSKKDFECLDKDTIVLRKVVDDIGQEAHYMMCLTEINCDYKLSFGKVCICTCPGRKEIFDKYDI